MAAGVFNPLVSVSVYYKMKIISKYYLVKTSGGPVVVIQALTSRSSSYYLFDSESPTGSMI